MTQAATNHHKPATSNTANHTNGKKQHFLTLLDLPAQQLHELLERAIELKHMQRSGKTFQPFAGKTLGMIFEKSSTRTRLSFEVGMAQFGGHAVFLSPRDTQLGRGEPIEDSARVVSSMVDAVMIRTFAHSKIETFAEFSSVPVINGLTDEHHPCQLLADMLTFREARGSIAGKTACWIGDGNNMCTSYILSAVQFGFKLHICTPKGYEPPKHLLETHKDHVKLCDTPVDAAKGAHLITTDVWASMGQEEEQAKREKAFVGFQVDEALLDVAEKDVIFLHCLPAHRGEEVSHSLLDDPRSLVWQQAENRLHAQKALLELLIINTQ